MVHKGRCEGFVKKNGLREGYWRRVIGTLSHFLMTVIGNLIWRRRWRLGRREILEGDETAFERIRKVKVMP